MDGNRNHGYMRNYQTILVSYILNEKVHPTKIRVQESREKFFEFIVIVICKAVNRMRAP